MPGVRGHHEGTLYQRKDGRWVAAVSLPDGRRVSRYARTKAEGRERLGELRRLRDAGATAGARLTVGAYLRGWLDDVRPNLAPATWRKHESICRNHIIPTLGRRRLSELTTGHVRALLVGTVDLDPQTRRHHRATLRRALADAVRDGLVTRNVAALAEPPKLDRRERPVLSAEQVRTLIDGTRDEPLHALWVLLATTGLREAEALGLVWESVDLDGASVRVVDTLHRVPRVKHPDGTRTPGRWERRAPKTPKSRRVVFLPAVTVEALRSHRRRQLEAWLAAGRPGEPGMVFVDAAGRPLHGSKLTTLLYPVLDRLELPRVRVHDLRHTAATVLYAAGVPLEAIADMLGHSTSRITADLYRHRVEQVQRDAADAMQTAIS